MSTPFDIPVWKKAPFIRLLLPLVVGIVLQWYLSIAIEFSLMALASFGIAYYLFGLLPLSLKFKFNFLQALLLNALLVCVGLLLTWQKDIRHQHNWFGNNYRDSDWLVVSINEPLMEKNKSYKATVLVRAVVHNNATIPTTGNLLLYFAKASGEPALQYGDKILLHKKIQAIKNTGNPGAFNYQQYAAFQSVFHQVFVQQKDWVKLPGQQRNIFTQWLINTRQQIIFILQNNIRQDKDALGIAEALLIGYTNDLDRDLVQAYSNTGVVHIIAISGMHLGLIYVLLVTVFGKIPLIKKSKGLQMVLILGCLWLFSLLTGAGASVLRSAVMFSFIAIGKNYFKQASMYNSLAASAFVLLCFNPYFLWDVGFQLSYLALLGIVLFQKPLYNLIYLKNKWVNEIWKLTAISTAAQVLTFPVCLYYFHQFPNLFLLTNIIAVPLSSVILYVEIALLSFYWVPLLGVWLGKITGWLVWGMNEIIVYISHWPFSVWQNISASTTSTILCYAILLCLSSWLLQKNKTALTAALIFLLGFILLQTYTDWRMQRQQKIIVYNVPRQQAIDFVQGQQVQFLGNQNLQPDSPLQKYHIKPSRILYQLNKPTVQKAASDAAALHYQQINHKKIIVIDGPVAIKSLPKKIPVDLIIISNNPRCDIAQLARVFDCGLYVFDAANSLWKIDQWQKACSALHLRSYSVPESGAFVLDL